MRLIFDSAISDGDLMSGTIGFTYVGIGNLVEHHQRDNWAHTFVDTVRRAIEVAVGQHGLVGQADISNETDPDTTTPAGFPEAPVSTDGPVAQMQYRIDRAEDERFFEAVTESTDVNVGETASGRPELSPREATDTCPLRRSREFSRRRTLKATGFSGIAALGGLLSIPDSVRVATPEENGCEQTADLANPEPEEGDFFGEAIDLGASGKTALIGAPMDDTSMSGEAYIFRNRGRDWTRTGTLTNPDPDDVARFGQEVALDAAGTTALVGAPYQPVNSAPAVGAVYAFHRRGKDWIHGATLANPEPDASEFFGAEVALSADGDTAIISAYGDTVSDCTNAGEVYVFGRIRNCWQHTATIPNPEPNQSDAFGAEMSLSADGTTVLIGVSGNDSPEMNVGEVYEFRQIGGEWQRTTTIPNPEPDPGDAFGAEMSLSADGTTALITGFFDPAVYVFERTDTGWQPTTTLANPAPRQYDAFGYAVTLSANGDAALVSAPNAGKIFGYKRTDDGWNHTTTLTDPKPTQNDYFGHGVALSADRNIALGADPLENVSDTFNVGEVYIFECR